MARVEGFEPPTAWFVARYSIQLSYTRAKLVVGSDGEGGIRTLDRVAPIQHFQCCAFDHSATSPGALAARQNVAGRFQLH